MPGQTKSDNASGKIRKYFRQDHQVRMEIAPMKKSDDVLVLELQMRDYLKIAKRGYKPEPTRLYSGDPEHFCLQEP